MTATLGECLSAAERHFAAAEAGGPPVRDSTELAIQARRLVAVLGRYLDNTVQTEPSAAWQQTTTGIRAELRAAGGYLDRALPPAEHPLWATEAPADPVAARYARAVNALAAGADLLRTHMSLGVAGFAVTRSEWARLLTTEPVAAALADEIAGWADRAGRMVDRISRAPGQHLPKPVLAAAQDRLAAAARVGTQAKAGSWDEGARRALLHAIPTTDFPERIIPSAHESDANLCAGITVSARRLRTEAFAAAREPGTSPVLSGPAWRRTAHASAIICDLAAQTLDVLAAHPSVAGTLRERLGDAASSLVTARESWRNTARMWQVITTETTSPDSPTTADATDLVVRLGRLAFGEPGWTPADAHKPRPRAPGSVAPGVVAAALGAVHEAADAVTRVACADLTALGAVGQAGRLYMRARTLGNPSARYAYIPAPTDRVHMLKNAFYLCADTTWRAASALDGPALEKNAPSKLLALIRAALPSSGHVMAPEIGFVLDPDLFARQTALFSRPRGAQGRRRSDLDPDEIIHAYDHEHLNLQECAERFSISTSQVTRILTEHGTGPRNRWASYRDHGSPPLPPPAPLPDKDETAPLYRQLRRRGINDPGLLERAALIDRAAADVLSNATQDPSRLGTGPQRRSPVGLAAQDGPRNATAAVRHQTEQPDSAQQPIPPSQQTPANQRPRTRRA